MALSAALGASPYRRPLSITSKAIDCPEEPCAAISWLAAPSVKTTFDTGRAEPNCAANCVARALVNADLATGRLSADLVTPYPQPEEIGLTDPTWLNRNVKANVRSERPRLRRVNGFAMVLRSVP